MSYETESIKREVQNLKYDLTRYIDREDHRREVNDLKDQIARNRNEFQNEVQYLKDEINRLREIVLPLEPQI